MSKVINQNRGGQTVAINTMPDGTCRLIKSQYAQTSIQNFESQASFGATGVIQIIHLGKKEDIEWKKDSET